MSPRKLWLASLGVHGAFWLLSMGLSLAFLYSSDDAWYAMARRHFVGTFLTIQLSLVPYYLVIGTLAFLWAWMLLEAWKEWKPTEAWKKRFAAALAWFWVTVFTVSVFSSFSSWFIPFSFVRQVFGIEISYAAVAFLSIPVWINAGAFVVVSIVAIARKARFKYVAPGIVLLAGCIAVAVWPTSKPAFEGSPKPDAPNLVIIGSDSLRADRLSCYGYARETSPTIDAIAKEGALCERMYVATPSTTESILAMMSGRTPREMGVRCIFPTREALAQAKSTPHLAQVLQQAGYRTVATGDWAASDFEHVIEGFEEADVDKAMHFTDYIDGAARRCHPMLLAFFTTPATSWAAPGIATMLQSSRSHESILKKAELEIERAAVTKRPLFLYVFLSTTHLPYTVPEGEEVVFGDPAYKGRHHRQLEFSVHELVHSNMGEELLRERQRVIDLYDSTVRAFDKQVARVAAALRKHGIDRNTLFVVVSDHGDDHWEPGTQLGRTLHAGDQSIRIPFVLRWPDRIKARRIPHVLRETDFPATVAELFGVEWASGGASFRKHLAGEEVADDREAFIEAGMSWCGPVTFPPEGDHLSYAPITDLVVPDLSWDTRMVLRREALSVVMQAKDRALVRGKHKLVYRPLKAGPQLQMFDLSADPHAQSPIPPDASMLSRLRKLITSDPEDFYLAWPREVFEAAFTIEAPRHGEK
jgi:arylsulfatase A-like enzyme